METDPTASAEFKVASWNIHKCVGMDGRFDPGRIVAVIAEIAPDVMALQEVDTRFGERRGLLDLAMLEREAGLVALDLPARRHAHGWHGNLIIYRPDRVSDVRHVHPVTLPGLEPRGALSAELLLRDGRMLRVLAAHFGLLRPSRRQQSARLVDYLGGVEDMPTLLLGDLNEWRIGKPSGLAKLDNHFTPAEPLASFPARMPVLALDRILGNRPGMVGDMRVHATPLSRVASDHLPLVARVTLPAPVTP